MSVVVSGATGHLGRLVVEELLARGVPATQLVAAGRRTETLADLGARGVAVRHLDLNLPETLTAAFAGAEQLLLISGSEVGQRVAQHRNAIEAAKSVGVGRIVYTSILKAPTTTNPLAPEHQATEALIRSSGLPFTLLRNGWYVENYTAQLPVYLQHGVLGSAGAGRISAASRADFAAAAAAVLSDASLHDEAYELAGDESFTMAELAAEVASQSGREVGYTDLPEADYAAALVGAGVPEAFAGVYAAVDTAIARGELFDDSRTLSRLAGRPTTSLRDAIAAGLAAQ